MENLIDSKAMVKNLKESMIKKSKIKKSETIKINTMKDKFLNMAEEVTILIKDPAAYDNKREEMAASVAMMANFAYTTINEIEKDIQVLKNNNKQKDEELEKLKRAIFELTGDLK